MIRLPSHVALACCLTFAVITGALAADIEKGKVVFERCAACHSLEAGKNEDAPTLRGIFGRKIAAIEEFRYSAAMKRSDLVWTQSTLDTFIEDPQAFIPGNRMPFDGLKDKSEREDLLAYLEVGTKTARGYSFKIVLRWAPETQQSNSLLTYVRSR
jgi:cytochrome c